MLSLVHHLIGGGRFDRARLTELGRLLARYEAQPGAFFADPSLRAMAERIVHLKRQLSEALTGVRSCAGCARGCGGTSGRFEGGRCCGTATLDVFTPGEVRSMKLARVPPPREPAHDGAEGAGCIFRGAGGCSLEPETRPSRCVVYVCHELSHELEARDGFERVQALRAELSDTFALFESLTR